MSIASKHNLHAKLTGAGGGGFALALLPPRTTTSQVGKVRKEMEEAGFDCWETSIGGAGVQMKS